MPILLGDRRRIGGIEHLEPLIENFRTEFLHLLLQLLAHLPDGRGPEGRAVEEDVDIKPRAADHDRDIFSAGDPLKRLLSVLMEFCDVERLINIADIDEMVGDERPLLGRGFSRADIHSPVDLGRVGREDFAADGLSQGKREGCFPRGGWPCDDDDPFLPLRKGKFLF